MPQLPDITPAGLPQAPYNTILQIIDERRGDGPFGLVVNPFLAALANRAANLILAGEGHVLAHGNIEADFPSTLTGVVAMSALLKVVLEPADIQSSDVCTQILGVFAPSPQVHPILYERGDEHGIRTYNAVGVAFQAAPESGESVLTMVFGHDINLASTQNQAVTQHVLAQCANYYRSLPNVMGDK